MQMIVHHPKSPDGQLALRKQVSTVHAQAVEASISAMSCPKQQKTDLLNTIKRLQKEAAEI